MHLSYVLDMLCEHNKCIPFWQQEERDGLQVLYRHLIFINTGLCIGHHCLQDNVCVEAVGYLLEELRNPETLKAFKADVESANIFIGSLIFVQVFYIYFLCCASQYLFVTCSFVSLFQYLSRRSLSSCPSLKKKKSAIVGVEEINHVFRWCRSRILPQPR